MKRSGAEPGPDPEPDPQSSVRIQETRIRLKMCHERGTLHQNKVSFHKGTGTQKKITILSTIYLDERHPEPEVCDAVGGKERGRVPARPGAGEAAAVLPARLRGGGQGGPPARPQDSASEPQAPPSRRGCPPPLAIVPRLELLCSQLLSGGFRSCPRAENDCKRLL
jgi:hypothetical protein